MNLIFKFVKKYHLFILFGLISEILYSLLFLIEPFRLNRLGETSIILKEGSLFYFITFILLINAILYFLCFKLIKNNKKFLITIFTFLILFSSTLMISWPTTSLDVFTYIAWGRVQSVHSSNPYITPYGDLTNDLFYTTIMHRWLTSPSIYGPIFIYLSTFITKIAGNILIINLFLFKFTFLLFHIFTAIIIYFTFKDNKILFLYACNPIFLFEFIQTAHSDVATLFLFSISMYFFLDKKPNLNKYLLSWTFLMLSGYIKYSTAILFPVFFLGIIFLLNSKKEKIHFIIKSILISLSTLLLYLPFLRATNEGTSLISLAFNPISKEFGFAGIPPLFQTIVWLFIKNFNINNPFIYAVIICKILFFIFFLSIITIMIITRKKITKEKILFYSAYLTMFFLLTFFGWVYPWYYTILLLLLIYSYKLNKNIYSLNFIYVFTFISICYYFILK